MRILCFSCLCSLFSSAMRCVWNLFSSLSFLRSFFSYFSHYFVLLIMSNRKSKCFELQLAIYFRSRLSWAFFHSVCVAFFLLVSFCVCYFMCKCLMIRDNDIHKNLIEINAFLSDRQKNGIESECDFSSPQFCSFKSQKLNRRLNIFMSPNQNEIMAGVFVCNQRFSFLEFGLERLCRSHHFLPPLLFSLSNPKICDRHTHQQT